MSSLLCSLLAWIPFITPLGLPSSSRLWMFPPLAMCIAVVYRATRARTSDKLLRGSIITFVNITIGMVLIGVGAYALHGLVLWWS